MRHSEKGGAMGVVLVIILLAGASVVSFVAGQKNSSLALPGVDVVTNVVDDVDTTIVDTDAKKNPVLARIDGKEIRRQDVVKLVNSMPPQMQQIPIEQLFPMALEQTISNALVDEKAKASGLQNDPDVKKQLAQAKEQLIRGKYVENAIKSRLTEERLQASYKGYVDGFPELDEVKAAHILVDDEKLAKDIVKKLGKGEDFAALAKEHSKDGSSENGGDLGYFAENEVVPEFAKAAFSTETGAYTKTPVKSQFGYHIIKVEEKRKRPAAPYEQVKQFLEQELQRTVLDEVLNEWKSAATIERFDINGNPLPEKTAPAAGEEDAPAAEAVSESAE